MVTIVTDGIKWVNIESYTALFSSVDKFDSSAS